MKPKPQHRPTEDIIFDANLKEFAHRIGIICALEAGEKIAAEEAYKQIKSLYKELKKSKKALRIGNSNEDADLPPS